MKIWTQLVVEVAREQCTIRAFLTLQYWTNIHALKALDTIGNYKNSLGNEQWRAIDSIKHCEKRLPMK